MSSISNSMGNSTVAKSDGQPERPEPEENQSVSSFVKQNAVPLAIGAGAGATAVAGSLLFKSILNKLLKPKKPHKHGFSLGKFGKIVGAASVVHSVVHPFTCGGGGMLLGAGLGGISSFLPKIWGHKHTSKCGGNPAKPASSPVPK